MFEIMAGVDNQMDWKLILSSTVFAAMISGIVSYKIASKSNILQYITTDRKEWREELRKIAPKIHGANYEKLLLLISELKVRINSFGKHNNINDYFYDSHIWKLIGEIEKEDNKHIFEKQKKVLIEYISLLLKYDWERSKAEVKDNRNKIVSNVMFFIAVIPTAISCFFRLKKGNISSENNFSFILFIIIMMVLINLSVIENVADNISGMRRSKKLIDPFLKYVILWLFAMIILSVVTYVVVNTLYTSGLIGKIVEMVCLISYFIGLLFLFSAKSDKAVLRTNYIKAVENLDEEYEQLKVDHEKTNSNTNPDNISIHYRSNIHMELHR